MTTPARDHWPRPFKRLAILGESTVQGGPWVPNTADRYADILVGLINRVQAEPVEYRNCGIGGNVISRRSPGYAHSGKPSAMERYEREIIAFGPDLFIMAYGLNDMRCGTPLEQFIEDMEKIVRDVQRVCQPLTVLVSVYHMTGFKWYAPFDRGSVGVTLRYNAAIRALAERTGSLYADVYPAEGGPERAPEGATDADPAPTGGADWVVNQDGVHANQVGNLLIAHNIFELLATHCSGLSVAVQKRDEQTRWVETTRKERYLPPPPVEA